MPDKNGNSFLYEYDLNGNISKEAYADGKTTEYAYNPLNQLVSMTDWNGTTEYQLDKLGRLIQVKDYAGNNISYTWDASGNKTSMVYPDKSKVTYEYDILSRLTKVTNTGQKGNKENISSFNYDLAGQLTEVEYPNQKVEKYFYDTTGNRIRKETSASKKQNPSITNYTYNELNQLTFVNGKGEKLKGNIVCDTSNLTYDDRGNLTQIKTDDKIVESYIYDARNQLEKVSSKHQIVTEYGYDGLGRRINQEIRIPDKHIPNKRISLIKTKAKKCHRSNL